MVLERIIPGSTSRWPAGALPREPVTLAGWKREIDATAWLITEIIYDLSDSALTSSLEMEMRRV